MTTPTLEFTPAEATYDVDGLVHGISQRELQILGEQCFEAKSRAYCMHYMDSFVSSWQHD